MAEVYLLKSIQDKVWWDCADTAAIPLSHSLPLPLRLVHTHM